MEPKEGNKLITEFMKNKPPKIIWADSYYHNSWDWLMPVVSKVRKINNAINKTAHDDCGDKDILDGLMVIKIGLVYDGVVKFIEWYNKQKS